MQMMYLQRLFLKINKRQASRRDNMKTYRAVIKTTQEWTKDIKIPDDVEDLLARHSRCVNGIAE